MAETYQLDLGKLSDCCLQLFWENANEEVKEINYQVSIAEDRGQEIEEEELACRAELMRLMAAIDAEGMRRQSGAETTVSDTSTGKGVSHEAGQ